MATTAAAVTIPLPELLFVGTCSVATKQTNNAIMALRMHVPPINQYLCCLFLSCIKIAETASTIPTSAETSPEMRKKKQR